MYAFRIHILYIACMRYAVNKKMEVFAKRLKALREEKGLSIRKLASALEINHASYARYEKDTAEPTQEMLLKIAKFFGVTPNYLLGVDDYN